jgi:hypothetical protein
LLEDPLVAKFQLPGRGNQIFGKNILVVGKMYDAVDRSHLDAKPTNGVRGKIYLFSCPKHRFQSKCQCRLANSRHLHLLDDMKISSLARNTSGGFGVQIN